YASLAAPTFSPVGVEAEDPGNLRTGGAAVLNCATCSGGYRVGYIDSAAQVVVHMSLPSTGLRTVTVIYESDGPRLIKLSANGTEIARRWVTGPGWEAPQTFQFVAVLPAGSLQLAFYDDESPAPDFDKVVVS